MATHGYPKPLIMAPLLDDFGAQVRKHPISSMVKLVKLRMFFSRLTHLKSKYSVFKSCLISTQDFLTPGVRIEEYHL